MVSFLSQNWYISPLHIPHCVHIPFIYLRVIERKPNGPESALVSLSLSREQTEELVFFLSLLLCILLDRILFYKIIHNERERRRRGKETTHLCAKNNNKTRFITA